MGLTDGARVRPVRSASVIRRLQRWVLGPTVLLVGAGLTPLVFPVPAAEAASPTGPPTSEL